MGSILRYIETRHKKELAIPAESVINRIDYEITMILGEKEVFSHPLMKMELEAQNRMLEYLKDNESVIDENVKNLYR